MSNRQNNFVDITEDLSNHSNWSGVLLFRGVTTFYLGWYCISHKKWYYPRFCRGDFSYTTDSLELKANIAVLDSFVNSPTRGTIQVQNFFPAVKTGGSLVVIVLLQASSFKLKSRGELMSIQNKKTHQNKSNLKLTALILTSLTLTACREEPDRTTIQGKAKYDASVIKHEVHADYLNCYPLDRREKEACLEQAADTHLKQRFERDYETYKKSFQRESEKLGFKYFLNSKGFACESVKHAPPLVDSKEEIYFVKCSSGESYQMQFDYYNKQWNLRG